MSDRPARTVTEDRFRWLLPTLVAVIVTLGIVLRFLPRPALWLDEALSVNIAGLPLREIPDALRHDGHPALYYVLLHFWMKAFGDSDWSVRAMSGAISTITIPVTYLAAKRLATRPRSELGDPHRVGLLAMALVAVMPFAVRYGAEARMYALVMLSVTLGYPLVASLLEDPRRFQAPGRSTGVDEDDGVVSDTAASSGTRGGKRIVRIIGAAALTAVLLWTHYWSIWLLGATGILTIAIIWQRRGRGEDRQAFRGPVDLLIAMTVGGLFFTPWLPTMTFQAAHTGTPWGEQFGPFATVVTTLVDFSGARFGAAQFLSYILVVLIVAAAVVSVRRRTTTTATNVVTSSSGLSVRDDPEHVIAPGVVPRIRAELWVLTMTLGLGWLTARLSGNTYSARYGAVFFPLFILMLAAGLALLRRTLTTVLVTGSIAILCVYGAVGSAKAERTQVGRLVDAIEHDVAQNPTGGRAVVIVCPDQLGVATQRQVDQRPRLHAITGDVTTFPASPDPRFVDWVDYADRNESASPSDFVDLVNDSVTTDTTLYLISSPHYRTLEGKCEAVAEGLAAGRRPILLESLDTSGLDESGELRAFRPSPGR